MLATITTVAAMWVALLVAYVLRQATRRARADYPHPPARSGVVPRQRDAA